MIRACFVILTSLMLMTSHTDGALPPNIRQQIQDRKDDITQIANYVLHGEGRHQTFNRLALLGDKFGQRLTGSAALEQAIDYVVTNMTEEGFDFAGTENVAAPKWIRGNESARMILPRQLNLPMMGLGSSIGTGDTPIRASVVVVRTFDELDSMPNASVTDKIVVFNQGWLGSYGATNVYRTQSASKAAKKGAVAALVHSVTQFSIASPHTGQQTYEDGVKKIPVACITMEDAQMLQRLYDGGEAIEIELMMSAVNNGTIITRNVVGEITGSEFPDQTVIVGGHIDSWDVGDGSMDDGGGVMISWEALSVLKKLNLRPRRTMRVVLWSAEEEGLIGGEQYFQAHTDQISSVSLIMESDHGAFRPYGIGFSGNGSAVMVMREVMSLLSEFNMTHVEEGQGSSSDTGDWVRAGVPGAELWSANENYFYFHHSQGDRMTVLNADDLDRCTLVWVTAAYVVASLDDILPRHDDWIDVSLAASMTADRYVAPLAVAILLTSLITCTRRRL